jgi:non-heme chloroperoxidase
MAALTEHLDLHDAVHVGHSTGGGEVARYLGRHGESRVAKAVLISAVTPSLMQTASNPDGVPQNVFDGFQAAMAANRSDFFRAVPSGPFYGYNRPGVEASEAIIANWWRQGVMGSTQAHYDTVFSWAREDYSDDLRKVTVPVLVMNGEDDQVVPFRSSGPRAVELLKNGILKTYPGFPHGMPTTQADTINADLLDFIRS